MNTHGITDYSEPMSGDARQFYMPARFDVTDGYLGITQGDMSASGVVKDRVLLSPKQVRALIAFYKAPHPRRLR